MFIRISVTALILFIGITLQIVIGEIFDFWINFALAVLIASAFFLDFLGLLALALLAAFALNWQPAPSYEMATFVALPLVAYFLREALPYAQWLSNLLFIFVAVLFIYLLFGFGVIVAATPILIGELLAAMLFGVFAFKALEILKLQ